MSEGSQENERLLKEALQAQERFKTSTLKSTPSCRQKLLKQHVCSSVGEVREAIEILLPSSRLSLRGEAERRLAAVQKKYAMEKSSTVQVVVPTPMVAPRSSTCWLIALALPSVKKLTAR